MKNGYQISIAFSFEIAGIIPTLSGFDIMDFKPVQPEKASL